jgi:hypothetical protein
MKGLKKCDPMPISMLERSFSLTLIDRSFSMRISQKPLGMLKSNQLGISSHPGITRFAKKLALIFSIPSKLQMLCRMLQVNALENHINLRLQVCRTRQYNISGKKQITLLKDAPTYQMALSAHSGRYALSGSPQNPSFEYLDLKSKNQRFDGSQSVRIGSRVNPNASSNGRFVLEIPRLAFKDPPKVGPTLHSTPHIDEPKEIKSPNSSQRDPKMTTVDLDKLSNKIYSLLERRLAIERERRGI